jgi:membrane-associated phospholipid phosphatase
LVLAAALAAGRPALAAEPTAAEAVAESPDDGHRLHWDFPRFRLWQYIAIGVQSVANVVFEVASFPSPGEHWRSPLPLDVPVRNALVLGTEEKRERADTVSDVLWWSTQYYPVIIDSLLVPLAFDRGNTDVAWQLTAISWQTIGLAGIVTRVAHKTVPRARPSRYGCSDEPGAEFPCTPDGPGFFSGHVSMSATGAALSCMHHAHLPLYGDGPAGAITCAGLCVNTVVISALRIASDAHWVSDVIVGYAVGASLGLGMPYLLHYQERVTPKIPGVASVAWLPWADKDSVSLSLLGAF